jgi:serine phosphatase RsbU (regulator of sigma subunit)
VANLFTMAGELEDAYRQVDWSATRLGKVESWGPTLVTALDVTLNTDFPATLIWSPDFYLLYNAAYVPLIGDKHPGALGAPTAEVFPEIWDTVGPMMEAVHRGDGTAWLENLRLDLNRRGFLEECYFTFSYSAVHGLDDSIEGVICIVEESTSQVLALRRLSLLSELTRALAEVDDIAEVRAQALPVLRGDPEDLPEIDILMPEQSPPDLDDRDMLIDTSASGVRISFMLARLPQAQRNIVLTSALSPRLALDEEYLGFLQLIAATCTQGIGRIMARQNERRIAMTEQRMSLALQRSLLTLPTRPTGIEVAVRYRPAVTQVAVGGDWYDSFTRSNGTPTVVIGDVPGHDPLTAATMAQIRSLLRGITIATQDPPAQILAILDRAMHDFELDTLATVLIAQFEAGAMPGQRIMLWSNAGHPPPLLLDPAGSVQLLTTRPEPLLGLMAGANRSDHTIGLEPGSTVVFYTDGLTDAHPSTPGIGLEQLVTAVSELGGLSPEQLCDHLFGQLQNMGTDDMALAVVRV